MHAQGCAAVLAVVVGFAAASRIELEANVEVEPTGRIAARQELVDSEVTNFLQAEIQASQRGRSDSLMRFLLGHRAKQNVLQRNVSVAQSKQPAAVPTAADSLAQSYFKEASTILGVAGLSTPLPAAALINAPPPKPTPLPWEEVYTDPAQPLHTQLGSAVISALAGSVTPTPPPSQAQTDMQFIAKCPLVLFNQNLSIRAPNCNNSRGRWIDPNPLNPRDVLTWEPLQAGGIRLGVDSSLAGPGAALFANVNEDLTLSSYEFTVRNCLGVERWIVEESVFKIDNIGRASSTVDLHDVVLNSVAYFYRYSIKSPGGEVVAQSTLYRQPAKQLNFTEFKNGESTGQLLAIATKQGRWERNSWRQCMAASSARGWSLHFPDMEKKANKTMTHASMSTVQDIRVAVAAAVTLMAVRDETRGSDGLNTESRDRQGFMLAGMITLAVMALLLAINFACMCVGSGMKAKLKKVLFNSQEIMPKKPGLTRAPALHTTW